MSYIAARRMLTKEKRRWFRCGSFNKKREKEERKIAVCVDRVLSSLWPSSTD